VAEIITTPLHIRRTTKEVDLVHFLRISGTPSSAPTLYVPKMKGYYMNLQARELPTPTNIFIIPHFSAFVKAFFKKI